VSGKANQVDVDIEAVNGGIESAAGIAHGERLVAFCEAAMGDEPAELERERAALRAVLSPAAFVDACAVFGAFNVVDRIADATGIPLDEGLALASGGLRDELDLARFASAANTAGAR
jgi:alkylhydroperoxidase family enzyme